MTEHDKLQDQRLDGVEEVIRQQTKILSDIRKYHMPWIDSAWQTKLRMKVILPIIKLGAAVSAVTIIGKGISWYVTDKKVERMASQYAAVANRLFFEEKDADVAIEFMDKAVALREKNADYRFRRAFMSGSSIVKNLVKVTRPLTTEEKDKAHRVLAEAIYLRNLEPNRYEPVLLEAQAHAVLKDADKAVKCFDQALEMAGDNLLVVLSYAECAYRMKDYSRTDSLLKKAEALRPDSTWVLLQRGEYYHRAEGDGIKARECYEKFLSVFPKSARAWYDLGWTYVGKDERDPAKARALFRKALALDPYYKEAYLSTGMTYHFEGNAPAAKEWLDKAIELDGDYLEALTTRAIVNGELGRWDASAADFEAAIRLDPLNADLYRRRARVLEKKGDITAAKVDLDFVEELKGDKDVP